MQRAATFASGSPVALDTYGTVREARGLTSRTIHDVVLDGVLHVHQPDDLQPLRQRHGLPAQLRLQLRATG